MAGQSPSINLQENFMRTRSSATAIAALLAFVSCGQSTPIAVKGELRGAAVNPSSNVLELAFYGTVNAKIVVGPAKGRVQVYGAPGLADGTTYSGVQGIHYVGANQVQFEVTQTEDFDVTVDTGAGDANIQTKYIIPVGATTKISPSVILNLGAGQKKVEVQVESFTKDIDFSVLGKLGAGATEWKGEMQFKQGSQNADANINIDFGASSFNKAELIIDNEARNLNVNVAPRFMQELVTKILGDDPSDVSNVVFSPTAPAGGSKIIFEMVSRSPKVQVDYNILGSAGMDEVSLGLTTIEPATVKSKANLELGASNDKLEVKYNGLPANINVFTGAFDLSAGDDEAKLEFLGTTTNGFAMDCNSGFDKAFGFGTNVINCENQ
jgi:hypothetical protein